MNRFETPSSRWLRPWAALLVTMLLLVPTLVRATQTLASDSASASSIRLNRGFDAPESKLKVPAPDAATPAVDLAPSDAAHETMRARPLVPDEVELISQYELPPDALRGPPSPSVFI
jgi:hypothetical protein